MLAKARRRAGWSMLVMMAGFMTIVLAVVYRLATMSPDTDDRFALQAIALPEGARIVSTQLQDALVTVTYLAGDTQAIRIFDGRTGALVREIAVVAE